MIEDVVGNVEPAEGSALPGPSAPNIVHVAGHTITLHPNVTLEIGMAALSVIKQGGGQAAVEAGLAKVYLNLGISDWDFTEKIAVDGKLVDRQTPITPENIARLLPYADGGLEVAELADGLYSNEVYRPLRRRYPELFQRLPTVPSTPATLDSGSTPLTPSEPYSPTSSGAGRKSAGRVR